MITFKGKRSAQGKKFGIVAAEFNKIFCDRLVDGASTALKACGGSDSDITLLRVPGTFEIPLACKALISSAKFDGLIALGVIIKGETFHFEQIVESSAAQIAEISVSTGVPIALGIIPATTVAQVEARTQPPSDTDSNENKGFEAAIAVVEMINLMDGVSSNGS